MILWLTQENKAAFEAIASDVNASKFIQNLSIVDTDMYELAYLFACAQIKGNSSFLDAESPIDDSALMTALFNFKANGKDGDKVLKYFYDDLDTKGLTLDLNQLVQNSKAGTIVSNSDQVKIVNGKLTLPASTLFIDAYAYENNEELTTVDCNENLSILHNGAFKGCKNLKTVNFNDKLSHIGAECFRQTGLESVELPSYMRSIVDHAFADCSALNEIKFNDGLLFIGDNAFFHCSNLTSIDIPDSCAILDNGAFSECNKVRHYNLGKVSKIGSYCFYDNRSIVELKIPPTVCKIGEYAFSGCEELKCLHLPASIADIDKNALKGLPSDCKVFVHTDSTGDSPISIYLYLNKIPFEVIKDA